MSGVVQAKKLYVYIPLGAAVQGIIMLQGHNGSHILQGVGITYESTDNGSTIVACHMNHSGTYSSLLILELTVVQ